jgi:hypothetical protein
MQDRRNTRRFITEFAAVTVAALIAAPALAQTAAQWPDRPRPRAASGRGRRGRTLAQPVERFRNSPMASR